MALGNPITLTDNVAAKVISVTATSGQTVFTVTGGYRINQLGVYRNGVRLVESNDYTASDGASVTLYSEATLDDILAFQIFDDFRVSDAIVSSASTQTISGNLNVTGDLTVTGTSNIGVVTGGGVIVQDEGTPLSTTATTLNFEGAGVVAGGSGATKTITISGGGGTNILSSRTTVVGSTGAISDNAIGNIDLTGFKSYFLMKVGLSTAGWLRLYTSNSSRTDDVSRSVGNDPIPGSGVIADIVTTGVSTTQIVSPFVPGGNLNDPADTTIYAAITNQSGITTSISVDLTLLQLEA